MKVINSFLEEIQKQVEQHLNTQKVFKDIPVLSHQESNFESCLNELIQTGVGLCILVMNPLPLRIIPITTNIAFEHIQLRVQVIESACTNTSQISALSIAEFITHSLHNFQPSISGWKGWLTIDESQPWKEIKDTQKSGRYIIEINFHIRGSTIKLTT